MATAPDTTTTDRIFAAVAAVAAALTFAESPKPLWSVAAVLVALVPWVLVVLRREPPAWLFLALAVLPVVPMVVANDVGVVLFMTTAAVSRFASRTDDLRAVAVVTVLVAVVPFLPALIGAHHPNGAGYFAFGDAFSALAGVLVRRTIRLTARVREADARLAEARAGEERQRVARDVHDLVAHSLTVVVLHVGGARRVLRSDPGAAEAALADAERVCRESLDGIRGVVGLLRDPAAPTGVSLDPDRLAATYRAAGLDVALEVDGDLGALPLAVRVVAYRVLQESFANAGRYGAGAVLAAVQVEGDAVRLRVRNPVGPRRAGGGGFGLTGLREQVAAIGGVLTSGPDGTDWVVAVVLPLVRPAVASA